MGKNLMKTVVLGVLGIWWFLVICADGNSRLLRINNELATDKDTRKNESDRDLERRVERAIGDSSSNDGNLLMDSVPSQPGYTELTPIPETNSSEIKAEKKKIKGTKRFKDITVAPGGICRTVDVRNYLADLEILRPCRVIEGTLQVVLMENVDGNKTIEPFDQLREITGYLLFYRVANLKSIGQLFPNLEVIRGQQLLADNAFMVYEMATLQELALPNLVEISRGGVMIQKNPSLCYAETIDWDRIVRAGENSIRENNNNPSQCPVCTLNCPEGHCWSTRECQKMEKEECHPQCLGHCFGPTDRDCHVCRNFKLDGQCIPECPKHLYNYLERRCITAEECWAIEEPDINSLETVHLTPFAGMCKQTCPHGYEIGRDAKNMSTCVECKGKCQRSSLGVTIRRASEAQRLRGVVVIKGSLELQIRTGNSNLIMSELAASLGQLEEIMGYLKVTHSFPITSLSFLKNLRLIHGTKTDTNNASLIVLDNPNLSQLFPEDQEVKILSGKLFMHYNPKLCMSHIMRVVEKSGITNITNMEVEPESNGDKVACDIVDINITVSEKGPTYANLEWTAYKPATGQTLLTYLLNYVDTKYENITHDTNSCSGKQWQIIDVESDPESLDPVIKLKITDLKPYTKYAVYVKTMMTKDKNRAGSGTGQSRIIFFMTEPDTPDVPIDVTSFSVSESEIMVNWLPPERPNGPLGYYKIAGFLRPENPSVLHNRNYCDFPPELYVPDDVSEVTIKTPIVPKSCCDKDTSPSLSSHKFHIFCYDNMAISALPLNGRKQCDAQNHYGVNLMSPMSSIGKQSSLDYTHDVLDYQMTRMVNDTYYSFVFDVPSRNTSYLLKKLRHYSLYTIAVAACAEKRSNSGEMCSMFELTSAMTNKKDAADNIRKLEAQESNDTIVMLTWEPPIDPNGLTVAYTIEWVNLMIKDAKSTSECLPASLFHGYKIISNLSPGRYSARVRAISLAGEGPWSEGVTFTVGMDSSNISTIAMGITFFSIFGIVVFVFFLFRNHQKRKKQQRLIASVNPDYIESKYVKDSWEVPRENVMIIRQFGEGNFGTVFWGILNGEKPVAIKTPPRGSSEEGKNEFLNEASVMKKFSSHHIVRLVGVVSDGIPPYVIMELMENGDLKTYLRKLREAGQLSLDVPRIIRMASEIADGMAYLESKKFVHRDLAARNCMVSKDIVCKIGDFGMTRDIYETDYYKVGQKSMLPIRWMAPESLSDGVFTSDSDVWSYGIVLYEILSLAELPYQGLSNDEVMHHVMRKGTIDIDRDCPEVIQRVMEKCFKWRPFERPTFMEIISELEPFIGQDFCEKSFYHSEQGVEIRNSGAKKVYHQAAQIRFHWGNETARWIREFEDSAALLEPDKASTSRGKIFKNGFQQLGTEPIMEDVPLNR